MNGAGHLSNGIIKEDGDTIGGIDHDGHTRAATDEPVRLQNPCTPVPIRVRGKVAFGTQPSHRCGVALVTMDDRIVLGNTKNCLHSPHFLSPAGVAAIEVPLCAAMPQVVEER
jgi:hypothetical protein